jgi:hypothetical protein
MPTKTDKANLQGVWQVVEITMTNPNRTVKQPGLWIFSGNHYSLTVEIGPRKPLADESKATAEELRELLRFAAQAGTYEIKGNDIVTHATVALRVAAMAPGNSLTSSYKLEGNRLSLTIKSTQSGPVLNPPTYKLNRIA